MGAVAAIAVVGVVATAVDAWGVSSALLAAAVPLLVVVDRWAGRGNVRWGAVVAASTGLVLTSGVGLVAADVAERAMVVPLPEQPSMFGGRSRVCFRPVTVACLREASARIDLPVGWLPESDGVRPVEVHALVRRGTTDGVVTHTSIGWGGEIIEVTTGREAPDVGEISLRRRIAGHDVAFSVGDEAESEVSSAVWEERGAVHSVAVTTPMLFPRSRAERTELLAELVAAVRLTDGSNAAAPH